MIILHFTLSFLSLCSTVQCTFFLVNVDCMKNAGYLENREVRSVKPSVTISRRLEKINLKFVFLNLIDREISRQYGVYKRYD